MLNDLAFRYEHCDIPAGVTLRDWRIASAAPARRGLRAHLRSITGSAAR